MKNKWLKRGILIVLLGLLIGAWTWRYVTLNRYYDNLDNGDYRLYQSGEFVPFEDDGLDLETNLNGYHLATTQHVFVSKYMTTTEEQPRKKENYLVCNLLYLSN